MRVVQDLRELKLKVQEIEAELDSLIQRLGKETGASQRRNERILPFSMNEAIFKGERPMWVLFPDGRREAAPTWRKVFEIILTDCNSDPERHMSLMELRGNLFGRSRVLLDKEIGEMHSPLQIDCDLYAETHYDVTMLLHILKSRILENVDYDYSGIKIVIRSR